MNLEKQGEYETSPAKQVLRQESKGVLCGPLSETKNLHSRTSYRDRSVPPKAPVPIAIGSYTGRGVVKKTKARRA